MALSKEAVSGQARSESFCSARSSSSCHEAEHWQVAALTKLIAAMVLGGYRLT